MAFWRKPIGDRDTFKLMLFCLGNGNSPNLISRWILLSQAWAPEKAEKSARQIDFVLNNADGKKYMVLLRPGSQVTVVPQRPAEAVKPRKKENKKKHHSKRKRTKTLPKKTRLLYCIKCCIIVLNVLKDFIKPCNKSSANHRSCLKAGYFALLLTRCAIEIVCSV